MSIRIRLKKHEAEFLGLIVRERLTNQNPSYRISKEQKLQLDKLREFDQTEFKEVKRTIDKNGELISKVEKLTATKLIDIPSNHKIKRVSTNTSTGQQWVITEPIKQTDDALTDIDFLSIFKNEITPIKINNPVIKKAVFDRAVFTDTHVGMDVNKDGYSLYNGIWNEEQLNKRGDIFINEIAKNQLSDFLFLNDLGDYMDGYDGLTTRGGHTLPQNMDNQKAFDVGLAFKIRIVESLFKLYNKIHLVNICNDNHSGSFGYIVNSALKTYLELRFGNAIVVTNQRKFIDHYIVENRCFILTHGKDDKSLKFGFKPQLDSVQIEKIKNYIDEYKLNGYKIEFSKGDSHQLLFDHTSSTAFEYQNFGAFSPPSDWVKTNFKNTLSSFSTFNYYENQKTINHYIF